MCEREITVHLKVSRRTFVWGSAALLMCCAANEVVSESMTMTTYYPAPSGVYKRLTATSGVGIGTYRASAAPSGGLIVSGNVGIGTENPAATLHVYGTDAIIIPVGTTAQRSVTPMIGSERYNTTLSKIEFYNGTKWKTATYISDSDFSCSGGNTVADRGGYRIHTFTTSGQFIVNGSGVVDVFVVGGGAGGGGWYHGGGGGGGGIVVANSVSMTAGTYNVSVGAGGAGGGWHAAGSRGLDSTFNGLAAGGGGGGGAESAAEIPGRANNGSGGGHSGYAGAGAAGDGSGHAGGEGGVYGAGGGGGAGTAGSNGASSLGGAGGAGAAYVYSGSMVTYSGGGGGGGGGGSSGVGGPGGAGGGGHGADYDGHPGDGAANTGGGGGGVQNGGSGGFGGSGIVIIRYPN